MDSNDEEQRVGHDGGQGEETENLELMREVMAWRRKAVKKVVRMRTRWRRGLRRLT